MKPLILLRFTVQIILVVLAGLTIANANEAPKLPVKGSLERPLLLLELGSKPPSMGINDKTTRVFSGEVYAHEGDTSIQTGIDEISSLHPDFGSWKVNFRFKINPGLSAKPYNFMARWKQGGDPNVCMQSFEIWAGSDQTKLELRATLAMKPKGWDYAWITAEAPVNLKADDAIIEVRNSGAGHDAKIFDAFMLAPLLSSLPTSGTATATGIPIALKGGVPEAWLVGGLQDGLSGMSIFGLDTETILRPNLDQPYLGLQMMGGEMQTWRMATTQANGIADIEANTRHSYGWSRGSGYAQLYLHVDQSTQALLHLQQSGIKTAVWLDGQPVKLADDPKPSPDLSSSVEQFKTLLHGLTTEGLVATALSDKAEAPRLATLNLAKGWHSLLIKLVMQHDKDQRFYFAGSFTDPAGQALDSIKTQLTDPEANLALNKIAARIRPLIFVDAPANLPHPDEALKLKVDMRWHPVLEETSLPVPLPSFKAKLRLRLVDYSGEEVAVKEINGLFPGEVDVNFDKISKPGYYAVYASLYSPAGQLIMNYPADGFSIVPGIAEQKQRLDKKKLWNNDYYALADGDKSFNRDGGYFDWLQRMGIYKSFGSYPGFDQQYQAQWERAKQLELVLFADSSGDSNWLNDNPADGQDFIKTASAFTRFFKSTNEIDIRAEAQWQKLREPEHWVQRAKWEYEQAHKLRSDAHYVGGSLVRPGDKEGAGQWFKQVLQLGLDQYQDAWDVHAYPQKAPRFGGPIGNAESEDERGVLSTYASLGKTNKLPFWLGETGAKAMHGLTGRRWQAEQVAKIIAWVNSRSDYLGLAFCIGHEYDLAYGRIWDYSMGHKPGEAALFTAGALIDGLPYRAVDAKDTNIQAAYFGETLMLWRTDEATGDWPLKLDPGKPWVLVDVVGHLQELTVDNSGIASIPTTNSPVYVLSRSDYERLTRY